MSKYLSSFHCVEMDCFKTCTVVSCHFLKREDATCPPMNRSLLSEHRHGWRRDVNTGDLSASRDGGTVSGNVRTRSQLSTRKGSDRQNFRSQHGARQSSLPGRRANTINQPRQHHQSAKTGVLCQLSQRKTHSTSSFSWSTKATFSGVMRRQGRLLPRMRESDVGGWANHSPRGGKKSELREHRCTLQGQAAGVLGKLKGQKHQ